ncbi:hypothetical protein [Ancylobacter polymorphus]|uniref:Uncharacterized protein n=1 Tax=Ancylobacter polymorphus TaxID=223390 RepID=A0ABU0BDC5_9HYPH|nr:hypothetical protein [Ancylobacter polymorphus]MDQ0303795.1 hypothetical protein [Ancylobacter polymorphus]
MATLHVEFAIPALRSSYASSIHGRCVFYEALTISATQANGTSATPQQVGNSNLVARLFSDTACFIATGSAADATATAATGTTSAKRFLPAGGEIPLELQAGERVSVIAA